MTAHEPQWLKLGREAAARALYEAWHPLRGDTGVPEGSLAWRDLGYDDRQRYLDAAEKACRAYHDSTLDSSRDAIASLVGSAPKPERKEADDHRDPLS